MELSKREVKMIQAISVLAMVWLHLFDRNYSDVFEPKIFWGGVPLSFYIAQMSDFCVFGFAFCSGYAHLILHNQKGYYKKRLKQLVLFLCDYWLVLVVFTVVSVVIGKSYVMPGSIIKFLLNALTLSNSYNGAWWYVNVYIIIVLLSPIVLKICEKYPKLSFVIGFGVYLIAYLFRFKMSSSNLIFGKFGYFGMTLYEYMIGALCYKFKVISKIRTEMASLKPCVRLVIGSMLIIGLAYFHTKIMPSLFIAPITGFIIIVVFVVIDKPVLIEDMLLYIGKHSTNIWLTHMFLYLYLFEDFIYKFKYPTIIFGVMLVITVLISESFLMIKKKTYLKLFETMK